MLNQEWVNYGDVNPFEHGGVWVKQESETTFTVVKHYPDADSDKHQISNAYVDITDSWIEKEAVSSYADVQDGDSVQFAIAALDYYGAENFGGTTEFISSEALLEEIKAYEIPFQAYEDVLED